MTGTFTGWVDSTMAMSAVPGWTVTTGLDTGWHWYTQNYKGGTLVYSAWCIGSNDSLNRVKWLVSNGFKPTCKVVWDYIKKFSGDGDIVGLSIRAAGIRVNTSGGIESNTVFGNYSGRWYDEFSGSVGTTITTTWRCTAPNGEAYDKLPYEGHYFWIAGFVVELDHPSGYTYWGRVTSVSLYWSK